MNRRQFLYAAGAAALASACSPAPEPETAGPPNIVLLMGDDHGWDETGYNGHPHLITPVLDEMAASGLRLDRFYSGHPSCSPTRASFMTGRHPNRSGTFTPNCSTRPEEITIGHLLRDAGYATAHFGKWHLGAVKAASPLNPKAMGFDEYLSHDNFFELDPVLSRNGAPPEKIEGESSEILVEETIGFIEKTRAAGDKPFFTVVWFGSPHEPYAGLEKDLALYDDIPEKYNDRTTRLTSIETGEATERPLGDVLRERYAEITAMDRAIGRLRDYLSEHGLRDNTLFFYCGDNGTPPDSPAEVTFRGLKGQVYEGGVRVPGVIEWPARIPAPRATSVPAVTSDLLPTLCGLLDIAPPSRPIDGVSLAGLFDGTMTQRPAPIGFWMYTADEEGLEPYIDPALQEGTTPLVKQMAGKYTRSFVNWRHPEVGEADYAGPRAWLAEPYKLVVHDDSVELFDVAADPAETKDLAAEHPDIVERLQGELRDWQTSVLNSLTGADYA